MANKYYISGGVNSNWNTSGNWSLTSGGSGGAGAPSSSDNVFIDGNSPNAIVIDTNSCVCNDLTIQTGAAFGITYSSSSSRKLSISGTLNMIGILGGEITLNYTFTYGITNFILLGTCGTVTYVNATKIRSQGGKRIVYVAATCTITNCPFWIDHTPVTRHIATSTDLQNINNNLNDDFILDNDIDLTGVTWVPLGAAILKVDIVGSGTDYSVENTFTGTFDGQGFTISNLTYDNTVSNRGYGALFGAIGSALTSASIQATIQDLNIQNFTITSRIDVGGLVGYSDSCYISTITADAIIINGSTSNNNSIGGLVGYANGWTNLDSVIIDCTVSNLVVSGQRFVNLGGLVGFNHFQSAAHEFTVTKCCVINYTMTATANDIDGGGGLIGNGGGLISHCYSTGAMNSNGGSFCGGLMGEASGSTIFNCYSKGTLNDVNFACGGLIGDFFSGNLYNCRADVVMVGGPDIFDDPDSDIGGLIGDVENTSITITNCYSTGIVTGTSIIGGFIANVANNAVLTNCAWYTAANANAIGKYHGGSAKATLAEISAGTDEPDNTKFYFKTEAVYAQGGSNPWDFTVIPIWYEQINDYPTFQPVPVAPVDGTTFNAFIVDSTTAAGVPYSEPRGVPLVFDPITGLYEAPLSKTNQEDREVGLEVARLTNEDQAFLGRAGYLQT